MEVEGDRGLEGEGVDLAYPLGMDAASHVPTESSIDVAISENDGACLEGSYKYCKNSVKAIKEYTPNDTELHSIAQSLFDIQRRYFYKLSATVEHNGHYYHETCTNIDVYHEDYSCYCRNCNHDVKDYLRSFMQWIYSQLEKNYKYITSEEAIIETINCNEYQFTIDGDLF